MITPVVFPETRESAYCALWLIDAPWAHPHWNQYVVSLIDLASHEGMAPAVLLNPRAKYEVICHAINPDVQLVKTDDRWLENRLEPPNHVHQFVAESDNQATAAIQALVDAIEKQTVTPDSDGRAQWDEVFKKGWSARG